jgi:transcriptional regulator with XRE-family HTH domain
MQPNLHSRTAFHGLEPQLAPSTRVTVGELIAAFRQRKVHEVTGAPWSQEELALASGTNQAHISRIESNRKHPQYSTLVRLCDALDLPSVKRSYLLALAGYHVEPSLPAEDDAARVVAELAPVVDGYTYPSLVMDVGERIWYVNSLVAEMWGPCLGGSTQAECLASARGRRSLQFLFELRTREWQQYLLRSEPVMDRHAALFWRAYHRHSQDSDMNKALTSLKTSREFLVRWQEMEEGKGKVTLLEHDSLPLKHPRFGSLRFTIWRTTLAADERFIVSHFPPADEATSRAVQQVLHR